MGIGSLRFWNFDKPPFLLSHSHTAQIQWQQALKKTLLFADWTQSPRLPLQILANPTAFDWFTYHL